jgi:hypothetical protein
MQLVRQYTKRAERGRIPPHDIMGRTFVMVQLCHLNDLDHSSFVARFLFGFLPYFLPFSLYDAYA